MRIEFSQGKGNATCLKWEGLDLNARGCVQQQKVSSDRNSQGTIIK